MYGNEPILSRRQTRSLQQHKYNSLSISYADAFMQPWWNFVVELMPLWLAPNLITIIGLAVNVFTPSLKFHDRTDIKVDLYFAKIQGFCNKNLKNRQW